MNGKSDIVKGRIKEAVGALTNNNDLRNEGKTDQAIGKVKNVVHKTVQDIQKAAGKSIDKLKDAVK